MFHPSTGSPSCACVCILWTGERKRTADPVSQILTWMLESRVARWHIFQPEIQIWVNFGGSAIGNVYIFYGHLVYFTALCFYGHLVYFKAIWYILWLFAIFFPLWYVVPTKIWQPCSLSSDQCFDHNFQDPILRLLNLQLGTTPALK
jgi:hypothetical protein